jgi:hypothetical protein
LQKQWVALLFAQEVIKMQERELYGMIIVATPQCPHNYRLSIKHRLMYLYTVKKWTPLAAIAKAPFIKFIN